MTAITNVAFRHARESASHGLWTVNRSYPVLALSGWQVAALRKIAGLSSLPRNWDSYGSQPVPEEALDAAAELVSGVGIDSAPEPSVAPVSGGALQIEWSKGERDLELLIFPNLTVEVTARDGQTEVEGSTSALSSETLGALLSWLVAA